MVGFEKGKTARDTALFCLRSYRTDGAWSDIKLKQAADRFKLSERDAALAYRMCYGVIQNMYLLDFYIGNFSSVRINRIEPLVLDILRLGVYQIVLMDRIPDTAAVNESVSLAKTHCSARASGYVNALLRSVSACKALPQVPRDDFENYLSIKYSHPLWLVRRFLSRLGPEQTEKLLIENNGAPPLCVQVNSLLTDSISAVKELESLGVTVSKHPYLPGCLLLSGAGNLEALEPFVKGRITVQDAASRMAILAANPMPRQTVIDACSAPGGKAFACAALMQDKGSILAFDIHLNKLRLIEQGACRMNISIIKTGIMNALENDSRLNSSADIVLADVPCSGLGVIRKKPDVRYKPEESLKGLPDLQFRILSNLSSYVKPGGKLLYSTCTLLQEENEEVAQRFLNQCPDFAPEPFSLPGVGEVPGGSITLWPNIHGTDGFFISLMRKKDG